MKETNLSAVKSIAKTLLYVDIKTSEFSPMIVHHPFTQSEKIIL